MPLIASRMTAPIITPSMKLIPLPFVVSSQYRIYAQEMDSSEKNYYRNIELPGVFASFPGAREISSISGSLPDDPGGITCMLFAFLNEETLLKTGSTLIKFASRDSERPKLYRVLAVLSAIVQS